MEELHARVVAAIVDWLGTDEAGRYYAIIAGLSAIYASLAAADAQNLWLKRLDAGFFETTFRGPRTTREFALRNQIGRLQDFKASRGSISLQRAAFFVLFGLLIPSAILGAGVFYYGWFFDGAHAIVRIGGQAVPTPSAQEIAWVLFSQFALGAFDMSQAMSAIGVAVPDAAFDAGNPVIAGGIFVYRFFVAGFTAAFLYFLSALTDASTRADDKLSELNEALEAVTVVAKSEPMPPVQGSSAALASFDDGRRLAT